MLLRISERMEQLGAVVLQIYVSEIGSSRRQPVQLYKASIMAYIKALHAVERHFSDFQALNPNEGFSLADGEKDAGLDCVRSAWCLEEAEAFDWTAVARQVIRFEER